MGGFGIIPPELENSIVSNHYFLYEIDRNIINPDFLAFYLKTGKPTIDIQSFVKGSHNYASIRQEHILLLEMPIPTISEQKLFINLYRSVINLELNQNSIKNAIGTLLGSTYSMFFQDNNKIKLQT